MKILAPGVRGLDLVLGGGIRVLSRARNAADSATILIRGLPGTGKTLLGAQLATSLARQRECDVAYACVEILPVELNAQLYNFKDSGQFAELVSAPFPKHDAKETKIFAANLDLEENNEQEGLGRALVALLELVKAAGGRPGVLVIDSLSNGYHLGSELPRILADGVCKFAAQEGLCVVLLEEVSSLEAEPSAWSFVVDTVLELSLVQDRETSLLRRNLIARKSRLGPSSSGPHEMHIFPHRGITVSPTPDTYLAPWVENLVLPGEYWHGEQPRWMIRALDEDSSWPKFRDCVTAVSGIEPHIISRVARYVGVGDVLQEQKQGQDIFVDFGGQTPDQPWDDEATENIVVLAGNPSTGVNRQIEAILNVAKRYRDIRKIVIGDFRATRSFPHANELRQGIISLIKVLRQKNIPTILYETVDNADTTPLIADVADVLISLAPTRAFNINDPPKPEVIDKLFGTIFDLRGNRGRWLGVRIF
jgi:KaiC/GvpD/RAD55 family RecA-like ATPase